MEKINRRQFIQKTSRILGAVTLGALATPDKKSRASFYNIIGNDTPNSETIQFRQRFVGQSQVEIPVEEIRNRLSENQNFRGFTNIKIITKPSDNEIGVTRENQGQEGEELIHIFLDQDGNILNVNPEGYVENVTPDLPDPNNQNAIQGPTATAIYSDDRIVNGTEKILFMTPNKFAKLMESHPHIKGYKTTTGEQYDYAKIQSIIDTPNSLNGDITIQFNGHSYPLAAINLLLLKKPECVEIPPQEAQTDERRINDEIPENIFTFNKTLTVPNGMDSVQVAITGSFYDRYNSINNPESAKIWALIQTANGDTRKVEVMDIDELTGSRDYADHGNDGKYGLTIKKATITLYEGESLQELIGKTKAEDTSKAGSLYCIFDAKRSGKPCN